jgi:hypothetical protein
MRSASPRCADARRQSRPAAGRYTTPGAPVARSSASSLADRGGRRARRSDPRRRCDETARTQCRGLPRRRCSWCCHSRTWPAGRFLLRRRLTEEVRSRLECIAGLRVIGGASSRQYRGSTRRPRDRARATRTHLLTATVRWGAASGGGRVRVNPELMRSSTRRAFGGSGTKGSTRGCVRGTDAHCRGGSRPRSPRAPRWRSAATARPRRRGTLPLRRLPARARVPGGTGTSSHPDASRRDPRHSSAPSPLDSQFCRRTRASRLLYLDERAFAGTPPC